MKVRIEPLPREGDNPECEVIIRCSEITPDVLRIKSFAESGLVGPPSNILLTLNGAEFIIPLSDILFFESVDDRVAAQTVDRTYYADKTLTQLESLLGERFVRASKSCIIGLDRISSLRRELTGVCEVRFFGSVKSAFVSRMYYKSFRERLELVKLGHPAGFGQ